MKRVIIKIVILISLVSIIVTILNIIVPNISDEEKLKIKEIIKNKNKVRSITFGRSHAASLDYKYYNKQGYNLALGGRDFASIYYQIKYLIPKLDSLEEVIIFITYSSFYFDNEAMSRGNLNDARKSLYYSIPSYAIINKKDVSNYFFGKFLPFIQADHGYSLLKKNIDNENIGLWKNWAENYMDSLELIKSGKKQADVHSSDRVLSESYLPNVVDYNINILNSIIDYLVKNNIRCILVTSPYYYTYTKEFPQKDIKQMYSIINGLKDKFNIEYYDFSSDKDFKNNCRLFHNADHLNNIGKKLFTEKLINKINQK